MVCCGRKEVAMQRQCAWCLRLIGDFGVRLSSAPVPKTYEASHGMCTVCADIWLEEVLQDTEKQPALLSRSARSDVANYTIF
jgi:hypothetical protein